MTETYYSLCADTGALESRNLRCRLEADTITGIPPDDVNKSTIGLNIRDQWIAQCYAYSLFRVRLCEVTGGGDISNVRL